MENDNKGQIVRGLIIGLLAVSVVLIIKRLKKNANASNIFEKIKENNPNWKFTSNKGGENYFDKIRLTYDSLSKSFKAKEKLYRAFIIKKQTYVGNKLTEFVFLTIKEHDKNKTFPVFTEGIIKRVDPFVFEVRTPKDRQGTTYTAPTIEKLLERITGTDITYIDIPKWEK